MRERLNLGDIPRKPRCGLNHEVEYMVLTKIDDILTWACPVEGCQVTKRFGTVELTGSIKSALTIRSTGHSGYGPDVSDWKDVAQYAVQGLPPGEEAWISRMQGHWSTLGGRAKPANEGQVKTGQERRYSRH